MTKYAAQKNFGAKRTADRSENASPEGKLYLRRYFLDTYHAGARRDAAPDVGRVRPIVVDCCQAEGLLWNKLRKEYDVGYVGYDRERKRGRVTMDSARVLAAPALPFDIIDVDTYGSPWRHWITLLPNIVKPTTVFLTLGNSDGLKSVDSTVVDAVGLGHMQSRIPQSLRWKLDRFSLDACLSLCYNYGVLMVEAQEVAPRSRNARYFGVRIVPPR